MAQNSKFTLIELLIVVAIISLLLTILIPSINNARERAKETVCLSNEKQIFIAFATHCSQNNNTYPETGYNGYSWDDILSESLNLNWSDSQRSAFSITDKTFATDIFLCPSDEVAPVNDNHTRRSYAVNEYKPKDTSNETWFTKALPGIISVSKDFDNQSIQSSQVMSPSSTVLMSEQWRDWNLVGAMSTQLNGYGLNKLAYDPGSGYWQNYQCHGGGKANILMIDGSAQMRLAQTMLEGASSYSTNDYRSSWLDHLH